MRILGVIPLVQAAFPLFVRHDRKPGEVAAHIEVRAASAHGAFGVTGKQLHQRLGEGVVRGDAVKVEKGKAFRDHEADAGEGPALRGGSCRLVRYPCASVLFRGAGGATARGDGSLDNASVFLALPPADPYRQLLELLQCHSLRGFFFDFVHVDLLYEKVLGLGPRTSSLRSPGECCPPLHALEGAGIWRHDRLGTCCCDRVDQVPSLPITQKPG